MDALARQSIPQILRNTAAAMRELAGEIPEAIGKGPVKRSEAIMREDRRAYVGIAIAALALVLLLFY
jgi:hypothetical protein